MNADKTERRWGLGLHALGFLASLAAVFALAALVYFPLRAREEAVERQLAEAWKLLNGSREISVAHEDAAAALKEAEQRIRRVHEQIPQGAEEATFMSQLGRLAAETEFEVLDCRP